jgi:hypothetical protein
VYSVFENWEGATAAALRIYDPFAYRATSFEALVPVCLSETPALAERWPVVWRRDSKGDADLVVVRGLDAAAGVPDAKTQSRTSLPLLLQAFPFRYRNPEQGGEIGLDGAAPMQERDAGAYVLDERGNVSPGAELKIRALETWGAGAALRAQVTDVVFRHGLVEPVQLPDALSARFALPDFFCVRAVPDDALIFGAVAREHWLTVARFLAAQRLSLYCMARLISLASEVAT